MLIKVGAIFIIFILVGTFYLVCSRADDVEKQIENLNEEVRKAQMSGDKEVLNEALKKYEEFINNNAEVKQALDSYSHVGDKILKRKKIAEDYFTPGKYELALNEYQKILVLTSEEKNQHNFGPQRASAFIEIGKIHLMIADETFKKALLEKVSPLDKKYIEDKINSLEGFLPNKTTNK